MVCPVCLLAPMAVGSAGGAAFLKNKKMVIALTILTIISIIAIVYIRKSGCSSGTCKI